MTRLGRQRAEEEEMGGEVIAALVEKIREEYAPERIILFGSYAYGNPDRDSDIDLLIIKETGERPIDRRVRVSRIVYDPSSQIPFEPIVLTPQELKSRIEIGDQFIEQILREGRTVYDAQGVSLPKGLVQNRRKRT